MRQWDTKKEFKPDYRSCAKLVFLGWLQAARYTQWRWHLRQLWEAFCGLVTGVAGVAFGISLLALSPAALPLLCLVHKRTRRLQRLRYIRRNRKVDACI